MSSYLIDKDAYDLMISIPLIVIGCFLIHYFMTYQQQQQQPSHIKKIDDEDKSDNVDNATGSYNGSCL